MEFSKFIPSFVAAPEFKELPLLVLSAVNAYAVKYPNVQYPNNFSRLVVLTSHIEDFVIADAKNSEIARTLFWVPFCS